MPAASILIKPVSSNCNIDCSYCFYKKLCRTRESYSLGRMSDETLEALVRSACTYAEGLVSFAFQGGEPMLAGLPFYRRAVELERLYAPKGLIVENTIQTNGVLIDREWAQFFAQEHFLVGVSLDGPKKLHGACRHAAGGGDTFPQVMNGLSLLARAGAAVNIATVVTEAAASQASNLYRFYKRNGFRYVQVIPCMGDSWAHGGDLRAAENEYSVRPASWGRFLCELFDLWYEDFLAGEDLEIRTFSNLAQMAAGFPAEECGMNGRCTCYCVVEADGSVYPCDFYCTDAYRLGDISQPFAELVNSPRARAFVAESAALPDACRACPHLRLCRGGCRHFRLPDAERIPVPPSGAPSHLTLDAASQEAAPRREFAKANSQMRSANWCGSTNSETDDPPSGGSSNLNYLCEGYQLFFSHCTDRIDHLGQMILAKFGR